MTPMDRFMAKVDKSDGCWLWTAHVNDNGYATFKAGGRSHRAHRWLWEQTNGAVPEGLHLDHLCRVRHCVNPDHLEPVTPQENNNRGVGPTAANARKTHCKRGHEFTPENTIQQSLGRRCCRMCKRELDRLANLKRDRRRTAA